MKKNKAIANLVIEELNKRGMEAYIYHTATTGSIYIRFANPNMKSIRVGDHEGREKYSYKFNLRSDVTTTGWKIDDNGVWRYFCPFSKWKWLVEQIIKRKDIVKDWDSRYGDYKTPSFKKFEAK